MVKENIIIPKENLAQIEEVRELENENQEQKKADEKQKKKPTVTESVKEAIVPKVHASDDDDDDYDAKIEQRDSLKEAIQHDKDEWNKIKRNAAEGDCEIS